MRPRTFVTALCIALASAVWADERELLREAERRFRGGNYAFALEAYTEFLEQYPLSEAAPDVVYQQGVSLFRLGRFSTALEVFELVERRYRTSRFLELVPFWSGIAYYELGEFRPAALTLREFVRAATAPELIPQALLYQGLSDLLSGRNSDAEAALGALVAADPGATDGPTAYGATLLAYSLLIEKRFDRVIELVSGLPTSGYPGRWREQILLYRAEALWELERFDEAMTDYQRLVDAEPEVAATALRRLFVAARRGGDFSAMQRWSQQAESRFTGSPAILTDFWLRLGIESYQRGADELAELFLSRVWEQEQSSALTQVAAPLYLAETLIRTDRSAQAVGVLNELIELAPEKADDAVMRLGDLALDQGRFGDAAELYLGFGEQYSRSPRIPEAAYLAAYALYRAGDAEAAAVAAENAAMVGSSTVYVADVLRLRAILARAAGNLEAARNFIDRLLELQPTDLAANLDAMKLAFAMLDHEAVVARAAALKQAIPGFGEADPTAQALADYLRGLSLTALHQYEKGVEILGQPGLASALSVQLPTLLPHAEYRRGWGLYQLGHFAEAADVLEGVGGELSPDATFLAGWAYLSGDRYDRAAETFKRLADADDSVFSGRSSYLLGKSLRNLGELAAAASAFDVVATRYPNDPVADDALFEHAETLQQQGRVNAAAATFEFLVERYEDSPLREEALYRSAEALLAEEAYERARDGFFRYRQEYPSGRLVSSALYWAGVAANRSNEHFEAVFLWENLIERFPDSSFRPDALLGVAESYVVQGDFSTALAGLTELLARHPKRADELGVKNRAEEVRLLLLGLTGREAELSAAMARAGGKATAAGRQEMLELARLYVFDADAPNDLAFQLLQDVIATDEQDAFAEASFLIGEYYLRRDDALLAAQAFLNAAVAEEASQELRAHAIYRSAQAQRRAGHADVARSLAQRIIDSFPLSQWVDAARAIVNER